MNYTFLTPNVGIATPSSTFTWTSPTTAMFSSLACDGLLEMTIEHDDLLEMFGLLPEISDEDWQASIASLIEVRDKL